MSVNTNPRESGQARTVEPGSRLWERAVAGLADGFLITEAGLPGDPIIYANPGFERLTGYSAEEVVGRSCRFLQGEDTDRETVRQIREAVRRQEPVTVELLNYRKNGTPFWNRLSIVPIDGDDGSVAYFAGLMQDVSESRGVQERLTAAEQHYRRLVKTSPVGIYALDNAGYCQEANLAMARITGRSSSDLRGIFFGEVIAPEDVQVVRQALDGMFTGEIEDLQLEFHVLRPSGARRLVAVSVSTIREAERITGVHGIMRDITESRRAEAALRESEEMLRQIADNIGEVFWIFDPDFSRAVYVSRAYERLWGRPLDAVYADPGEFFAAVHPDDLPALRAAMERICHEELAGVESRVLHPDGSVRWVLARGFPVRDERGEVYRVVGTARDITERKLAETVLRESERRLRQVLDALPVGVILTDTRGAIIWHNPAADRVWDGVRSVGADRYDEYRGWRVETGERIPGEQWAALRALEGEESTGELIDIESFEGVRKTILNSAAPLRDEAGRITGALWVQEDITEQRALEDQLRQSQKMEAVGRLAGGIAHDFNNMLTAIIGHAQLMLGELNRVPAGDVLREDLRKELHEDLREIEHAADRSASLTRQLLAFSRKQILQPRVLSLNDVVEGIAGMLRRLIGEDIQLVTVLDQQLRSVHADQGQIEQVLVNLVVNARDAMPGGGTLTLETRNTVVEPDNGRDLDVEPGPYVQLSVADTGVGMPDEVRERAFEPFFTTKDPGRGTGLGLSTVYGIIKQSGGDVRIESRPAHGSVFHICLPAIAASRIDPRTRPAVPSPQGRETVLVVEDEPAVRALAVRILTAQGYTVLGAGSGEEALQVIDEHPGPIHLVLTDVVMPRMGGKALVERLPERFKHVPVLFMSGYTDEAIVHHGVLTPGTEFIEKPFSPDSLARRVRALLDR